MNQLKAIITILMLIAIIPLSSGYVPQEERNKPYMTDYDVYSVSLAHLDQPWAQDNIEQLMINYTNNSRCRQCLDDKMNFYKNLLIKKVKTVQKLPIIRR